MRISFQLFQLQLETVKYVRHRERTLRMGKKKKLVITTLQVNKFKQRSCIKHLQQQTKTKKTTAHYILTIEKSLAYTSCELKPSRK